MSDTAPITYGTEFQFTDTQLVAAFHEFAAEVKAGRTHQALAVGVHHVFARALLDGAELSAAEKEAVRAKFDDVRRRGGHVFALPMTIAARLEVDRRAYFVALEKKLAEEAEAEAERRAAAF